MSKKFSLLACLALIALVSSLGTGCSSTQGSMQGYSIRTYQGPLPMTDYRRLNPEAYGASTATR